ncbi:MAG TPA: hypothetical protein VIF60_11430 [Burkholderiaceae bacterium]|jgi:DNA-binding CsgD family transcriptional regulator
MSIVEPADAQSLLGSLYDSVMAPKGFQDFIETLCRVFRSKSVTMMTRHSITEDIKGLWVFGSSLDSYVREYGSEDMLAQHIMSMPIALFYASNLDVPYPETFPATRFYQEWVVPQGIAYATGATVLREGDWLTQLYIQRSPSHAPFTREELDQLDELVPHLQRAIQMRQRFAELQLGQNFLSSSLDVLAMPTLLFDEYCRVVHVNRSGESLLRRRADCWVEDGHMFTRNQAANRNLNLELTKAIRASRGDISDPTDVVLLPRSGRMPLILMLKPLPLSKNNISQGAALMFIFDPEQTPAVAADVVKRLFGLSKAEADLAVALCCGKTLEDAAADRGITIHTTRYQLKSIFRKTGTKRQSDLVSLLLSSPAYFLAEATL